MPAWSPLSPGAALGVEVAFGQEGATWARGVARRFRDVAAAHHLALGEPLSGGLLSAVCGASDATGRQVVLKGACDPQVLAREVAALRAWGASGDGRAVEVICAHDDVVVLERVVPGRVVTPAGGATPLDGEVGSLGALVATIASTRAIAGVPAAERERRASVERSRGRLEGALRELGELRSELAFLLEWLDRSARELEGVELARPRVLCHGDLWCNNVLEGADGRWVMIDPYPVAGVVESDLGLWSVIAEWGLRLDERVGALAEAFSLDETLLGAFARFHVVERAAISCAYGLDPQRRVPQLVAGLRALAV